MSTQPVSGAQYFSIGTIGTNVVCNQPATLKRIYWGGTYIGTVIVHDASSAAGTSATSVVSTIVLPGLNLNSYQDIGIQCRKGIVTEATGTPILTVVWDK